MLRTHSFALFLLAMLVVFLSASCDPDDCPDGFISINPSDTSGAEMEWRITSFVNTPTGPASSIVILDDVENTYTVGENELVTVFLIATDNQSGIRSINVTGGFGFSCQEDDESIVLGSGTFPGNPFTYGGSMTCGAAEGAYQVTEFTGSEFCSGIDLTFRSASFAFEGIAENNVDIFSLTRLTINVNPSEL